MSENPAAATAELDIPRARSCARCHAPIAAGDAFCSSCGALVADTCPGCGAARRAGANFCYACGTAFPGTGSVLSIGSVGSVLCIGSMGSILSIGSTGSVLSIGGVGSILSIGPASHLLGRAIGLLGWSRGQATGPARARGEQPG
jgi:hypothetical protein